MNIFPGKVLSVIITPPAAKKVAPTATAETKVTPSASAGGQISQAQQALRHLPETDSAQVAAVKAELKAGQLTTDADAIARAILDYFVR